MGKAGREGESSLLQQFLHNVEVSVATGLPEGGVPMRVCLVHVQVVCQKEVDHLGAPSLAGQVEDGRSVYRLCG